MKSQGRLTETVEGGSGLWVMWVAEGWGQGAGIWEGWGGVGKMWPSDGDDFFFPTKNPPYVKCEVDGIQVPGYPVA